MDEGSDFSTALPALRTFCVFLLASIHPSGGIYRASIFDKALPGSQDSRDEGEGLASVRPLPFLTHAAPHRGSSWAGGGPADKCGPRQVSGGDAGFPRFFFGHCSVSRFPIGATVVVVREAHGSLALSLDVEQLRSQWDSPWWGVGSHISTPC